MQGLMQHHPLLISSLIENATRCYPDAEIVSRSVEGPIHRTTYAEVHRRAKRLANMLLGQGVKPGDRVATLAWNGYRHMELYFAVSGIGAVLHTINPRLFPDQLEYIVNHAEDTHLFFDINLAPLVAKLAPATKTVKHFIAMTDSQHMPADVVANLLCYEDLLAGASDQFDWPQFDENSASSLCYTSGTTGNPKGVLYSHRATLLHSFMACAVDGLALSSADSALLVVPMFHVNAWGTPYAGAMCGAKLVMPGAALDGKSVYELMRDEKVTVALGVPSVWLMLFSHVEAAHLQPQQELVLKRVIIGGSAAPRAMSERFETQFGSRVVHAWGMTELSPIGTVCNPLGKHRDDALEKRLDLQMKQGRGVFGISMKISSEEQDDLPWDGQSAGHLKVKGHWVTNGYYRGEGGAILDDQGYFDTGDIATIDADGYMQITDRAKDVIKSGGEWISSIDLENAAMGHAAVAEAAVIAIAHPKWQERPLLVVVKKAGKEVTATELIDYLAGKVAKWWLPDDVVFVDELPHTATGKLQKMKLRERFRDYRLPEGK